MCSIAKKGPLCRCGHVIQLLQWAHWAETESFMIAGIPFLSLLPFKRFRKFALRLSGDSCLVLSQTAPSFNSQYRMLHFKNSIQSCRIVPSPNFGQEFCSRWRLWCSIMGSLTIKVCLACKSVSAQYISGQLQPDPHDFFLRGVGRWIRIGSKQPHFWLKLSPINPLVPQLVLILQVWAFAVSLFFFFFFFVVLAALLMFMSRKFYSYEAKKKQTWISVIFHEPWQLLISVGMGWDLKFTIRRCACAGAWVVSEGFAWPCMMRLAEL